MVRFDRYKPNLEPASGPLASAPYLAGESLATAVNTAIMAEQPLLITGEPGTGKTSLARSIADQLQLEYQEFHTRSDHQARDLLYSFDNMRRFYDAQIRSDQVLTPSAYVTYQALGKAIAADTEQVVLIDEIDKASRDFPNDLLDVIDRMRFEIVETGQRHVASVRPIVVITSNSERELPEPFLRRCVFHHIKFPEKDMLRAILTAHFGAALPEALATVAVERFLTLRKLKLDKPPATGELLIWVRVLLRAGVSAKLPERLRDLPRLGTLLKTLQDMEAVQADGR